MSYKFQNDWNKNSKWLLTKKARQKMCTWKGTKNLVTVPKLYCNAKYWRLGAKMWMAKKQRQKYKPLQSKGNLIHWQEQVPKDEMQKQAKSKWQ